MRLATPRGGEAPGEVFALQVTLEGPEVDNFRDGLGADERVAGGVQAQVDLVRGELDDDGSLVADQLGVVDGGGEDGFDFGAMTLAGGLTGGDGALEGLVDAVAQQGFERGAVTGREGGDDHAEGGLGAGEEFGRVEAGVAVDDLHEAFAQSRAGVGDRAAGAGRESLAFDDGAVAEAGHLAGGNRRFFEADAPAQDAAQAQAQEDGDAGKNNQGDGKPPEAL